MRNLALLSVALLLCGCAGMTTAETTGAVAGAVTVGGTFLAEMLGIIRPFLEPEQVEAVTSKLVGAQNWMQGIVQTVGVVGEQVAKLSAAAQEAQQLAAEAKANGATMGDVVTAGVLAVASDRGLSAAQRAHRRAKRAEAKD